MKYLIGFLLVAITVGVGLGWAYPTFVSSQSPIRHDLRKIGQNYEDAHKKNGQKIRKDGKAALKIMGEDVDPAALKASMLDEAKKSGQLISDQMELAAFATGSLLSRPFPRIDPLDRFWVDTAIPFVGPLHIWVTPNDANRVWREAAQRDETGPEGITWDATNPMPPIHTNKGKVAEHLPYLALIGLINRQVIYIGSQVVACPEPNATLGGNVSAHVNIFVTASGHLVSSYDNDLRGGFTIQFKPVDPTWCDPVNSRIRVEWIH